MEAGTLKYCENYFELAHPLPLLRSALMCMPWAPWHANPGWVPSDYSAPDDYDIFLLGSILPCNCEDRKLFSKLI